MVGKFITTENVRLAAAIIALMVPVFGCYYSIRFEISDIRGSLALVNQNMSSIKTSVDQLCTKYDNHASRISDLDKSLAVLENELEQAEAKK